MYLYLYMDGLKMCYYGTDYNYTKTLLIKNTINFVLLKNFFFINTTLLKNSFISY